MLTRIGLPRVATALLVFALTSVARAQDTRRISGTVLDSTGTPIPYANIDGGPRYRTLTNASGEWALTLPAKDRIQIAIRRIGFLPGKLDLEAGGDTSVTVVLQPLAILMETQVIRAKEQVRNLAFRGFYERMAERERGSLVGEYVTPEEIEMRNPQRVTQLLEQRRGITVRRVGSCNIIATCFRVLGANNCVATVYLDGHRINRLGDPAAAGPGAAPALDELITVTSVSAIEVYPRGSSAPPKYQSLSGTCAVVVIWTK
jgi:hypothetical protein